MSVAIKLYKRALLYSQEFLVVIPSFPRTSSLHDLRREIENEELLSNGNYIFVHNAGHACGKEDEKTLTIEDLVNDDANILKDGRQVDVEIKFVDEETEDTSTEENVPEAAGATSDSCETESSTSASWQTFKYPKPWEVKNVKIYSPDEIIKSRGMKSSYCKFWNKRAKELCSQAPNLSKKSICTTMNEEWRLEQERILKEEAEVINKTEATPPNSLKAGTLKTNISAIEEASAKLRSISAKLGNRATPPSSRKDLLAEQARARSRLKRAQETMRKNLKVKKSKINAVVGEKI